MDTLKNILGTDTLIIFGAMIIIGIVLQIIINNKGNKSKSTKCDYTNAYKSVDSLLTKAELSFYDCLESVCNELNVILFAKVRMADLVEVTTKENKMTYFNKVKSKHIDFVLCDIKTLKPLVCLELDDKSHNRNDRVERDNFIDEVLINVGYKVIHIPCKYNYNKQDIKLKIQSAINKLKAS